MAQRTVCLCDGNYIGIETIYTVVNGRQINIPEKIQALRAKSRNNELFCPCGCGSNLILVAGDRNLREQHFRLKEGSFNAECNAVTEGKVSLESKIVLKCWLDDKLKAPDIETRVPIRAVDSMDRKYEFTFLSRGNKIALSYCHERANLSDEKFDILESNSLGIRIIYIVDNENAGGNGQYQEGLMKIQNRQGYCLFLCIQDADYGKAILRANYYDRDLDGLWQEISIVEGALSEFDINEKGQIVFSGQLLDSLKKEAKQRFEQNREAEKKSRAEEERKHRELLIRMKEEEERRRQELREKQKKAEAERNRNEEVRSQQEEEFKRSLEVRLSQQETPVRDADGIRWIKCEFCGKIAVEDAFASYGGRNHINLGTCKECAEHNPAAEEKIRRKEEKLLSRSTAAKQNQIICPLCGGKLVERNGKYGRFLGCKNFPYCRYNRRMG